MAAQARWISTLRPTINTDPGTADLPKLYTCPACYGDGVTLDGDRCPECNGSGRVQASNPASAPRWVIFSGDDDEHFAGSRSDAMAKARELAERKGGPVYLADAAEDNDRGVRVSPRAAQDNPRAAVLSPKQLAALGWSRFDGSKSKVYAKWAHRTGWELHHCGHPTANYPWLMIDPDGRTVQTGVLGPAGRADFGSAFADLRTPMLWLASMQAKHGDGFRAPFDAASAQLAGFAPPPASSSLAPPKLSKDERACLVGALALEERGDLIGATSAAGQKAIRRLESIGLLELVGWTGPGGTALHRLTQQGREDAKRERMRAAAEASDEASSAERRAQLVGPLVHLRPEERRLLAELRDGGSVGRTNSGWDLAESMTRSGLLRGARGHWKLTPLGARALDASSPPRTPGLLRVGVDRVEWRSGGGSRLKIHRGTVLRVEDGKVLVGSVVERRPKGKQWRGVTVASLSIPLDMVTRVEREELPAAKGVAPRGSRKLEAEEARVRARSVELEAAQARAVAEAAEHRAEAARAAEAAAVKPAGYGEVGKRGQLVMFNPSPPRGALTLLGLLTRLQVQGLRKVLVLRWGLKRAPLLSYDEDGRLHVVYRGKVERAATAAEVKEYQRSHWGAPAAGKVVGGGVAVGPFVDLGAVHAITYTTRKGSDAAPVDYVHDFGEGSSKPLVRPRLVAHDCKKGHCGPRCAAADALDLHGGSYRVTERGIVG
jgi:hypothetical protein